MKKIIMIGFVLLICGCSKKALTSTEIDQLVKDDKAIIVDVREFVEYKHGHIKDAVVIPLNTIDESISLDKDKKIIVYCRSGARSEKASKILMELGYDVYDLGSINNYKGPIVEE